MVLYNRVLFPDTCEPSVSQEMWWSVDMAKFSHRKRVSMLEHPALAVEIETAAYALLTLMKLTRMEQAGHVAAWLIARHKSNGHFVSTQVIVVMIILAIDEPGLKG